MTTFVTADQHFGHANIIRLTNRPFVSVQEMNNALQSELCDAIFYAAVILWKMDCSRRALA
jgi:calcineurin-like phosphoesterase family protein